MKTENIQNGPCINCGATYYPLSFGGPDICPTCDCSLGAVYHPNYVNVRAERDRLKAINAEMLEALKRIVECCEAEPDSTCAACGKLARETIAKAEAL